MDDQRHMYRENWEVMPAAAEDVIRAHRVKTEVTAGELAHAEWARADAVRLDKYWSGDDAPAGRQAEARLLWSEEALTVRFICNQSEPLVLSEKPQTERKTLGLWERDVCEIFIAPDAGRPERYFEFEAAPTGEWLDLEVHWTPEKRETDWEYHSGMTAAAHIGKNLVTIAMRVPWKALGRRPRAGQRWRANLFRCVGAGQERGYLAWQPTHTPQPSFHVPQAFGWIQFE